MRKLVVKTTFITLGVALILLLSLFGVLSLCAPAQMAKFTYKLGLETLSGDYSYQEYERSGDVEHLARSFEIAVEHGGVRKAESRFSLLVADEHFAELCAERDGATGGQTAPSFYYRGFVYGKGACMRYRLARSESDKIKVCEFAVAETEEAFPAGSPVQWLAWEAASKKDFQFCELLLNAITSADKSFAENLDYTNTVVILQNEISKKGS